LLLILDYINVPYILSEKVIFQVYKELYSLKSEYTGDKIKPVNKLLPKK
jgi:hypothetical protein